MALVREMQGGEGRWSTTHSTATHTGSQPVKNQGAVACLPHAVLNVDDAPEEDATLVFTPFGYVAASSEENVEWLNG